MRILIDTNVLISAILFPNPNMNRLMERIALEHTLVLPSHVMEELDMLFDTKFKGKKNFLKRFFAKYSYDYVYTPSDINPEDYPEIRDKTDLPILVSAIIAGVDLIITGDKDFFDIRTGDIEIELPVIITPKEFLQGAYIGIRNPKAHSLQTDLDRLKAAQHLVFASLLARRIDEAKLIEND